MIKTLLKSVAIIFVISLPYLAFGSVDLEAKAIFRVLNSRIGTPVKIRYDYDKNTGQGQIIATYRGSCAKVDRVPCLSLRVNTIHPIENMTFEPEVGVRGALVYRQGEEAFICAYRSYLGYWKATGACVVL